MDGQAASSGEGNAGDIQSGGSRQGSVSEYKGASAEANLEEMRIQDNDLEQPDGQRSSLSLDDDGGTHFESHPQETVIRHGAPVRDPDAGSPTLQEGSDDNDIVFNPIQRLNFDEEIEEDFYQEGNGRNVTADAVENSDTEFRVVNGSDVMQEEASGGMPLAQDQGQNIRIIEGHDSSLLDDGGNSSFGFGFLQTQMVQLPLLSPLASTLPGSIRMDDEANNLYDSLEREDGSSPYRECQDHGTETNSSQYFSANSMALMAANSHGQDSGETFWSQDENADHENFFSHPHQPFHISSNHVTDRNLARQQSPPRNFQGDASSMFMPKRRGGAFTGEGNMDGFGDINSAEEDNTDGLSVELSEEGLLHNNQTYAQPVTANSSGLLGAAAGRGDMGSHPSKEWSSAWGQTSHINFDNTANRSGNPATFDSQPKNLARSQGVVKNDTLSASQAEVDGMDVQGDERQAGAGSSSNASDQNQSAGDSRRAVKKPINSKLQTRRPAVQGSASASDNKKAGGAIPRSSTSGSVISSRKIAAPKAAGNVGDKSGRGNSVPRQKVEPAKAKNTGMAGSVHNSRQPQGQASTNSPLPSRTNSHTSLASNASSTNSRVSGVGKESHMTASASARGVGQHIVGNESSLAQRQDGLHGEASSSMIQSNPQHSQSFERIRPAPNLNQPEPRATQSFSKSRTAIAGSDHPPQISITSGFSDHFPNSQSHATGDQHLPPRPHDNQHRRNMAGGNNNTGNPHDQQQHFPSYHLPYGGHQATQQHGHSGFPIQPSMSPSGSEGSQHSFNRDAIMTQMEALKRQGHQLSPNTNRHRGHLEHDIQGMEEVRSHLHNMLRIGVEAPMSDSMGLDHSDMTADMLLSEQPINRQLHFDSEASSFVGNNPQENMSEILENFPSFSSKIFSDMAGLSNRNDTAVQGENQYLRDQLEKERYRRKHCEEHIQRLNTKLLEVQQQLAVAVSTDKRKDIMIEQLDKQLAKVVEGWKKREGEKDEFLRTVSLEKEQIEESLTSQQTMINNFEKELAHTVEELRAEKVRSAEIISSLKDEIHEAERAKESVNEILESEREKFSEMTSQWEDLRESKELAEKRAQLAQERLIEEQDNWLRKEQEFQAKITEVKEANQKVISLEKVKVEEQKKKREEAESQNEELKTELKKAVLDLEQLIREKESQKVEMSIMEAKFESAQRKLEADLHGQMEKEIADQAKEFHTRIETSLEEASERHRKQITEIHTRHQRDMERQAAALNEEREKKEGELHKQLTDLEEKLQELRTENSNLKQSKIKLESQRMEILTKLQFMMQSQWNEAVSLLVSTPQKKSLNSSFLSSQSGGQLTSSMAVADGNPTTASVNLLTSGPSQLQGQDRDSQGSDRLGENTGSSHSLPAPPSGPVNGIGMEEKHEEMNGRDKVEEYLQRLDHQLDIPMTRNDLQVPDLNQGNVTSVTSTTATTANNSLSFSYNSSPHHRPRQLLASSLQQVSDSSFPDGQLQFKPSSNLSSSLPIETHGYGFNTGQTGSDPMPTLAAGHPMDGHMSGVLTDPGSLQAIAMRSPQQSFSRFNHESRQFSQPGSEQEQIPQRSGQELKHMRHKQDQESQHASHSYLLSGSYGQGLPPPHHQRHHPQQSQYHHQRGEHGHRHGHSVSFSLNRSNSNGQRPGADDFGDHKDMKMVSGTGSNVNLYSPDSPTFTSSPAQVHTTNCSQINAGSKTVLYPGSAAHHSEKDELASMLTHSRDSVFRPVDGTGQAMKKQTIKSRQQFKSIDHLNDSLSPPVKQAAERDHPDSISEASSGFHDPNRLHANYSQLSDRMEEHQSRQGELQHYVRMLLQKAPGSVYSEPERDLHSEHDFLESSRELTVDLDLNDTATAAELTSQLTRLQTLREQQSVRVFPGQGFSAQQAEISNQSNDSIKDHLTEFMTDNGVISAEGLSEISHLLNLYREHWEMKPDVAGQGVVANQLMDVLTRGMAPGNSSEHMSRKEEKKTPEDKMSPTRSHPPRKVKDLSKTRKARSGSQSGDTSITQGLEDKATFSTNSRSASNGPGKKGTGTQEMARDRKMAGKQSGSKGGGGAVWK